MLPHPLPPWHGCKTFKTSRWQKTNYSFLLSAEPLWKAILLLWTCYQDTIKLQPPLQPPIMSCQKGNTDFLPWINWEASDIKPLKHYKITQWKSAHVVINSCFPMGSKSENQPWCFLISTTSPFSGTVFHYLNRQNRPNSLRPLLLSLQITRLALYYLLHKLRDKQELLLLIWRTECSLVHAVHALMRILI